MLDVDKHLVRFAARDECVEQASRFLSDPTPFAQRASRAAQHILSAHTWHHRLEKIIDLLHNSEPRP